MLVLGIRDDKSLTNELVINSFEDLLLSLQKQIVMLMRVILAQKNPSFQEGTRKWRKEFGLLGGRTHSKAHLDLT